MSSLNFRVEKVIGLFLTKPNHVWKFLDVNNQAQVIENSRNVFRPFKGEFKSNKDVLIMNQV